MDIDWIPHVAFYDRVGPTALDETITEQTWRRFFAADSSVRAFVAEMDGRVAGIAHCVFHRSTSRLTDVCYLQDLFTEEDLRGKGIGRALIEWVIEVARESGCSRVYWKTQAANVAGRALYDKLAEHRGFIVYNHELT